MKIQYFETWVKIYEKVVKDTFSRNTKMKKSILESIDRCDQAN